MKVNAKIAGVSYADVPYILLPGESTAIKMINTSDTTAKREDVANGKTFYDSNGEAQTGTGNICTYEEYDECEF